MQRIPDNKKTSVCYAVASRLSCYGRQIASLPLAVAFVALVSVGCTTTQPLPPPDNARTSNSSSSITVQQVPVTESNDPVVYGRLRPDPDPSARVSDNRRPVSSPIVNSSRRPASSAPSATPSATSLNDNPFVNQPSDNVRLPTIAPRVVATKKMPVQVQPTPPDVVPSITKRPSTRVIEPVKASALQPLQPPAKPATDRHSSFTQSGLANAGASSIVLGEGDVILFNMFGQEDMETTAFVSSQGSVSLPLIGDTQVGGLTPGQAEQKITDAYRSGGYFKNPQVNITLETYRSQQISVLGEVNVPGRYPLETRTTLLDALAQAEGVKQTGSRRVTIIRKTANGTERTQVDLDNLVSDNGDLDRFTLVAGDIVYVPEAQLFYIYGEVRRPDAYAIKPGMTLMQALSLGGGLTDKGSNSRIVIQRKDANGSRTLNPELNEPVRPDDVIYVKERFF